MEKEGNNLFQVNLKGMIALLSEHIYSKIGRASCRERV